MSSDDDGDLFGLEKNSIMVASNKPEVATVGHKRSRGEGEDATISTDFSDDDFSSKRVRNDDLEDQVKEDKDKDEGDKAKDKAKEDKDKAEAEAESLAEAELANQDDRFTMTVVDIIQFLDPYDPLLPREGHQIMTESPNFKDAVRNVPHKTSIFLAPFPHGPVMRRVLDASREWEEGDLQNATAPLGAIIEGNFNQVVPQSHGGYTYSCRCWMCRLARRISTTGATRVCIGNVGLQTALCAGGVPDTAMTSTAALVQVLAECGYFVLLFTSDRRIRNSPCRNYAAAVPLLLQPLARDESTKEISMRQYDLYHLVTCTPTGLQDPATSIPVRSRRSYGTYYGASAPGCELCAEAVKTLKLGDLRAIAAALYGMPPDYAMGMIRGAVCLRLNDTTESSNTRFSRAGRILMGKLTDSSNLSKEVQDEAMTILIRGQTKSPLRSIIDDIMRPVAPPPMYA
jgi:hypothetical protein